MRFFSQQGEDLYVLKNFINKKNVSGIFVEVGALDGIMYSNTAFLEQELNFAGILIEPSHFFDRLEHTRPGCMRVNAAIHTEVKKLMFREHWARSGIVETIPDFYHTDKEHGYEKFYEVDTIPLSHITRFANTTYIDFMSIDVEGGELEVLKSIDWNIPIYVICIEMDTHNPAKDDACREILINNGFIMHGRLGINEFWVNEKYERKPELFDPTTPYVNWESYTNLDQIGTFIRLEPCAREEVHKAILGSPSKTYENIPVINKHAKAEHGVFVCV
jgi:FkbM family methyltransferase